MTLIDCDDDGGPGTTSTVKAMDVKAGDDFKIEVGGSYSNIGNGLLTVELFSCPAGSITEAEPCGDNLNGGCFMSTPAFESVDVGDVACGSLWAVTGQRDVDWYELTINEYAYVAMNVFATGPVVFGLAEQSIPGCTGCEYNSGTINPSEIAEVLEYDTVITYALPPGTHYFVIQPNVFAGYPCSSNIKYTAEWTTTSYTPAPGDYCSNAISAGFGITNASKQHSWFKFQGNDKDIRITSCMAGQNVNTDLYVYDDCCGSLIASNDNDPNCGNNPNSSLVEFYAESGITYYIYWANTYSTEGFSFNIIDLSLTPVVNLGLFNTTCGDFEVRVKPTADFSSVILTNLTFTLKWPDDQANPINLVDFSSDYDVVLQSPVVTENNTNYAIYSSTTGLQVDWLADVEYTVLSFSHDKDDTGYADFTIDTGSWATNNGGDPYIALSDFDFTGVLYNNSLNAWLGECNEMKVFLQGPYAGGGIMNSDLTDNIPLIQPYNTYPWNYSGGESLLSEEVSILPLGNSITQSDDQHLSYRYNLWTKLIDDGIDVNYVGSQSSNYGGTPIFPNYKGIVFDPDHEGHWGFQCDQILAGLSTWISGYTPDIVLIHLGTNDLYLGTGDPANIEETIGELEDIITLLRNDNPNVIILLAKLIPSTDVLLVDKIPDFNAAIPQVAIDLADPNSPIIIVDQFDGFDASNDTFDGVHPNETGEEKMAQKWRDAINGILADQASQKAKKQNKNTKDEIDATIVDWLLVELRSDATTTIERKAALLRNDGMIVQYDHHDQGVHFNSILDGNSKYVVIWHRNHMPVMTAASTLFDGSLIDFTDETICYGSPDAEIELETGIFGMIAGDITGDGILQYSGPGNDRGPIIARIVTETGSGNINGSLTDGYWTEDLNLNNHVLYTGTENDRGIIMVNLNDITGSPNVTNLYTSTVPGAVSDNAYKTQSNGILDLLIKSNQQTIDVVLVNQEFLSDGLIDNIQFTLGWYTKDNEISNLVKNFTSELLIAPQGDPIVEDGITYQVFASVNPVYLPPFVNAGEETNVLRFNNPDNINIFGRLWIAENNFTQKHNGNYYVSVWGKDLTGYILDTELSIDENPEAGILIFPNPVLDGKLNIIPFNKMNPVISIQIYDMYGRLMSEKSMGDILSKQDIYSVDVSQLKKGAYIIDIITEIENHRKRIIID